MHTKLTYISALSTQNETKKKTGATLPEYLSFHFSMLLRLVYTNCESRDH